MVVPVLPNLTETFSIELLSESLTKPLIIDDFWLHNKVGNKKRLVKCFSQSEFIYFL